MTTELVCFTQWARDAPQKRYTSLMGMLCDPAGLRQSFDRQPGNKAAGVDGMKKADYGEGVEERLADLSAQLRRLAYRPQPARRTYIPKANGGRRPLGIPCFEDRIVQSRLAGILGAIWEPEFRDCSFGFRPGRNAHQALKRLGEIVTTSGTQWLVEADIKGFFNHVGHDWLMRFLEHRIADRNLLRVIRRFLKAGVTEDGVFQASDEGTPQGGLVSPVLANIYLHYVLDMWFEKRFAPACRGRAYLVRYADDYVACFTVEADARAFQEAMVQRLAEFGLEVEPSKTALMHFGSQAWRLARQEGQPKAATFNFLGFTHFVGRSRRGCFMVGRKTQRERMSKKLVAFGERLKKLRTQGGKAMMTYAKRHLRGHLAYYAVSGNSRCLRQYFYAASRLLFKWLNRRSQRRSVTWARFGPTLRDWLPRIHIQHHLYPSRSG
jgi:group II intron reverse transcriptase/maturase